MKREGLRDLLPELVNGRFTMLKTPFDFEDSDQNEGMMFDFVLDKPEGLWYSLGDGWFQWALHNMPGKIHPYVYKLELNLDTMCVIRTEEEFREFHREYKKVPRLMPSFWCDVDMGIDWYRVAQRYAGVEIEYLEEPRFDYPWYYTWDVGSGCIWSEKAIKDVQLIRKL